MAKEAAKEADLEASNWHEYFHKIRVVCPWSYTAWTQNKIEIVMWQGAVTDLGDLEARVYVHYAKPRLLKKLEQRLNDIRDDEEWLHSHPQFGVNATHVPVLIQQNRKGLQNARKSLDNARKR